jgi:hypothetical protein
MSKHDTNSHKKASTSTTICSEEELTTNQSIEQYPCSVINLAMTISHFQYLVSQQFEATGQLQSFIDHKSLPSMSKSAEMMDKYFKN